LKRLGFRELMSGAPGMGIWGGRARNLEKEGTARKRGKVKTRTLKTKL
jgi:hypothetical protein